MDYPIVFNGKFLAHRMTGTERYAFEVLREISSSNLIPSLELVVPHDAILPDWLDTIKVTRLRSRGIVFEQIHLPLYAGGRYLISLAGPAPIAKANQLVVMHDATPFRYPKAFTRSFVYWYRAMYGILSRRASDLVTVSKFSQSELSHIFRLGSERWHVVPCAAQQLTMDSPRSRVHGLADKYLLLVGTQVPHKNVEPIARHLAAEGWDVVLVGGQGSGGVFSKNANIDQSNQIKRLGRVSDAELAWLYANAHAFVFPSHYEGFGIPVIEAQNLGCPVIASSAASLPEVGANACLFADPHQPATFSQAALALEDAQTREGLIEEGFLNASRFSWGASAISIARLTHNRTPRRESSKG